jgi:hypothetical protein
MTPATPDEDHYWRVATRIVDGYVIPFLGAGANLADRPPNTAWEKGKYLPSGAELAEVLARRSRYPESPDDLLRVSQYVDAMFGEGVLYQYLHQTFNDDYPPNNLHLLLARIATRLRTDGPRCQVIMTTNYDDALERAFRDAGEEFDLVWYEAKRGERCGKFIHRRPGEAPVPIDVPNEYVEFDLSKRTVILKLHGAVDRDDPHGDSYVITEDDYIKYLAQGDISGQIPITLRESMTECHFLFLGYSMRDWNLRVILNRIWGQSQLPVKSWAVQMPHPKPKANDIERKLWADRGDVELLQLPLKDYVERLAAELEALSEVAA